MRKTLLALSLLSLASLAQAADISLGLSNKTIAADYTGQPVGQGLEVSVGGLHHSDNGDTFSAGLQVTQQVNYTLTASLGGKVFGLLNDVKDASGLALGGKLDVALPAAPKVHLGVHGWFAPKVTSTSGTKNFEDVGAYVSYRLLSNGEVFAAYRRVRIGYDDHPTFTLQSGPLVGMKLVF